MTNLTATSFPVNPTPTDAPRTTKGRFASPACPWAVQEVLTPHYEVGYRVGPGGMIFASKAAAIRFAKARIAKLSRESVNAN